MGSPEGGSTPELSKEITSEYNSHSLESAQGQPPVLHPIKARMGPLEQDSNRVLQNLMEEYTKENFVVKDPRDKFSTFFRSGYSISYLEYQPLFIKLK